ncbi:hypothetical protein OG225_07025 [Nocardia sp. NBC_01377]|uniref:hypothetical protein n=1 Tax=Nocardia sp. NBC_01377 TaxID=2903595 RepID=UPI00324868EB
MRTWTFDLTYRRGQLTGNRMRPPRGTQIREMGLELLGEHATHNTSHDNDLKPRALWFDPPGPHTPGTLQLTWLSDHWPPPRTPPATGRLNWGQGTSIIEFASRATPTTITAIALHHHFTHHTDTETWTTARLRTRSGVLFKRDHTHYLTATHLLDAITNRWTLLTTWTPPGLAETPTPLTIPPDTLDQLRDSVTLHTVRHCAPATAHQIATRLTHTTAAVIQQTPLEFDIDLRCHHHHPDTLAWFRTLCTFTEIASLGRYTPTGLGSITTTPQP